MDIEEREMLLTCDIIILSISIVGNCIDEVN